MTKVKAREEDLFKGRKNEEDEDDKEGETVKDRVDTTEKEAQKQDEMTMDEEKQTE